MTAKRTERDEVPVALSPHRVERLLREDARAQQPREHPQPRVVPRRSRRDLASRLAVVALHRERERCRPHLCAAASQRVSSSATRPLATEQAALGASAHRTHALKRPRARYVSADRALRRLEVSKKRLEALETTEGGEDAWEAYGARTGSWAWLQTLQSAAASSISTELPTESCSIKTNLTRFDIVLCRGRAD